MSASSSDMEQKCQTEQTVDETSNTTNKRASLNSVCKSMKSKKIIMEATDHILPQLDLDILRPFVQQIVTANNVYLSSKFTPAHKEGPKKLPAYQLFSNHKRAELKETGASIEFSEFTKYASEQWKLLSKEEKNEWQLKATQLYEEEVEKYKLNKQNGVETSHSTETTATTSKNNNNKKKKRNAADDSEAEPNKKKNHKKNKKTSDENETETAESADAKKNGRKKNKNKTKKVAEQQQEEEEEGVIAADENHTSSGDEGNMSE